MLCSHLGNCSEIIVSGICSDFNQLEKILELLKVDIIIIASSNYKFVNSCKSKISNKPLLLISSDDLYKRFLNKIRSIRLDSDFQFLSLNSSLSNLKGKIAILSNSKLNQVNIKNYSFISLREKEILQLILKGKKNKEIAEELFLSIKTIENHRNNILKKTKSKNMILLLNELYKVGFLS